MGPSSFPWEHPYDPLCPASLFPAPVDTSIDCINWLPILVENWHRPAFQPFLFLGLNSSRYGNRQWMGRSTCRASRAGGRRTRGLFFIECECGNKTGSTQNIDLGVRGRLHSCDCHSIGHHPSFRAFHHSAHFSIYTRRHRRDSHSRF